MNIKTKRMICLMVGIASVLTIIGTVSYAYFTALGETTTQEATISTGTARATFRDSDTGITGELAFGESITKKFTIENTGTVETYVKMYWKDLINTYTEESLTYTLSQAETSDGTYTEVVSKTIVPKNKDNPEEAITTPLAEVLTIPVGKTYYYNLIITLNYLTDVNQDQDITAKFSSSFGLQDINYKELSLSEKTLFALGKTSNGIKMNFDDLATTDEGIFEIEDDYGTSYYYRGAVEDNYVKYGVNKADQEMWWRIIRINGDGSVRMIYDGTQGYSNGTSSLSRFTHTKQVYNNFTNDVKYVGWMYGPEGTTASKSKEEAQTNAVSSEAKKVVDIWYKENIEDTGYGNNISDEIFCNDRSTSDLGYGFNNTTYGGFNRFRYSSGALKENAQPTLKCPQQNDAFTVNDTSKGNGALTYPVGLITGDEVTIAGGRSLSNSENKKYYLFKGTDCWYWTMSPYDKTRMVDISRAGMSGYVAHNNTEGRIAPVINLTSEYANSMIGTGTITDPYRAKEA